MSSKRLDSSIRCPMESWIDALAPRHRQKQLRKTRERGWNRPIIELAFGSCIAIEVHSQVSAQEAQLAVLRAVQSWNQALSGVQIELADQPTSADILVDWFFASTDPEAALHAGIQAHADFPPGNSLFGAPPLAMHFNADFLWGIEQSGCFDIETIALHELGHLLGLIYHSGPGTIMDDALGPAPFFVQHTLDAQTIERVQQLYAPLAS